MQIKFTTGDIAPALEIMREAAQWQIDQGAELWLMDTLTREMIPNPPDEFYMAWVKSTAEFEAAACCLLSTHDPVFWPEIPAGTSGFLHKIAVRRKFAGQGIVARLIAHAEQSCRARGIPTMRLDTDISRPKLRALYESLSYVQVGKRRMIIPEKNFVPFEVALYEKELA